ncbi:YjcZ family sporulation protein [Peribacillus simplex]
MIVLFILLVIAGASTSGTYC